MHTLFYIIVQSFICYDHDLLFHVCATTFPPLINYKYSGVAYKQLLAGHPQVLVAPCQVMITALIE